ncbi:conserved hypothetical protein [Leishmania braziliensis MHOM/BR/75/M2904]|uniref:Uncharacterized protein n=1 Tax=Leishmania braziliensis TaxID=5660 RepID=A4H645_LEIBR|nr:conserved hypothetical protein [Leishmania braziliensis MHOM/BR/75/M2904]CAJ2467829.1 unnamed protein product [Leishmania braziliensis]CAM37267.2 conserved hypothetical protein [Leishmania braziliensis MHOM/BR/75/M2904]
MSYRATHTAEGPAALAGASPASASPYLPPPFAIQHGSTGPATFSQVSPSPVHSSAAIEELLRENTALRARLQLSDEQRVTQEVLREQLHRFFESVAAHEQASQKVLTDQRQGDGEESGAPDDGAGVGQASFMSTALSEVLHRMQEEKEQAEASLAQLQSNTVAPLHAQLEAMENEKQRLVARVAELEMSMSNTPAPPLVAELRQLRETEALLRQQLQEYQESTITTVGTFRSTVEDGLLAAWRVPELIHAMEVIKEDVRTHQTMQVAQSVLLEEMERRHAVERETEATYRKEETTMLRERIAHLEDEVSAATARGAAFAAEREAMEAQLAAAQEAIRQLTQQHSEEQVALAQKRQRAEQDARSNPSSIRGELTKFWYEGRDRIRELERQLQAMHTAEANLRVSQGRVAQLEHGKATLLENIAALAAEIDRRREEEKKLRAQCAGVEAERDRLLMSVAKTTGSFLSEGELLDCCRAIREAATRVAAASATVVADPQAIEEARRRAQKLKSEVAQLQRQKDQLQRFLVLHEDRVRALLEQEALLLVRDSKSGESATALSPQMGSGTALKGAPGAASTAAFSLPQFLEYVRQGANDVFLQNEDTAARAVRPGGKRGPNRHASASGDGSTDSSVTPHRDSFFALHQQLVQSQERLFTSHRDLLEARNENRRMQAELDRTHSEHAAAAAAEEKVRRSIEVANAALAHRTTSLTNELQELQRHYTSAVTMVRTTLEGLSNVLQLYHQSEQHAAKLREMVQQERQDMSDMLRREAASWGVGAGTDGHANAQEAQHSAAAERITAALRDMEAYIAEAVAETTRQAAQDQSSYIGKLVKVIQQQEERVRAAKAAFEASAQAQASSLAERISAAQQQWESTWRAKYQAIEAERMQSVMQQHASVVLQHALEQALTTPAVASSAASPESTAAAPPQVEESTVHMIDTLQAIRNFLAQARQRQAHQQEQLQKLEQLRLLQQQQKQTASALLSPATEQTAPTTASVDPVSAPAIPPSTATPLAADTQPPHLLTPLSITSTTETLNVAPELSTTSSFMRKEDDMTETSTPFLQQHIVPAVSAPMTDSTALATERETREAPTEHEEEEGSRQEAGISSDPCLSALSDEEHPPAHPATPGAQLDETDVQAEPQESVEGATAGASQSRVEEEDEEALTSPPTSLQGEGE